MTLINRLRAFRSPDLAHIIESQDQLQSLLSVKKPSIQGIAAFLEGLDHPRCLAAIRSLGAGHQKKLFDAAGGFRKVRVDDLVPPKAGVRCTVRHYGKNSLPAFRIFEKRFIRPEKGAAELWGYNHQAMSPLTGPGYFVATDEPGSGEVLFDYTQLPPEQPAGWPRLKENTRGFSLLVYAHTVDRLRGVTREVSIGKVWKKGKPQPAYFVLCREPLNSTR
jgi:hypothetical protein